MELHLKQVFIKHLPLQGLLQNLGPIALITTAAFIFDTVAAGLEDNKDETKHINPMKRLRMNKVCWIN